MTMRVLLVDRHDKFLAVQSYCVTTKQVSEVSAVLWFGSKVDREWVAYTDKERVPAIALQQFSALCTCRRSLSVRMPEELSVTFVEVQPHNIEQLRALNIGLFPVKYQVCSRSQQA